MALSLRLRRALTLSSSLLKDRGFFSLSSNSSPPSLTPPKPYAPLVGNPRRILGSHSQIQAQSFRSSAALDRRSDVKEPDFGPDEILFAGCDYNHWLITIDFPKDPEPTPEEMVETYVQTAAKVFGSVEEAKQKIYACSTTTYRGFQCICDEATSEKFKGLPGVVFILPDSYIDPVNEEYGGDKYENGVITPRPPPIQYGRQGRYNDRNRNYDQPRQPRYGDGSRSYDQRGPPPQEGRGYGPPPQDRRGYGPPPQEGRGYAPPPQDGRGFAPPPQDGRGYESPPQEKRGYGPPPQDGRGYGPPPQDGRGFGPPPQDGRGFGPPPQEGRGFGPSQQDGRGYGQGDRRDYAPANGGEYASYQSGFPRGQQGSLPPQEQRNFSQGQGGDYRPGFAGDNRQNPGPVFSGESRPGPGTSYHGDNRQGPGFGDGPNSTGPVEGQWQQAKY